MGTTAPKQPNPGVTWPWVIELLKIVLKPILTALTLPIRQGVEGWIKQLYKKCVETPNPIDDLFAKFLADILSVKVE